MVAPSDRELFETRLLNLAASMPPERRRQLLEYASFLADADWADQWRTAAQSSFAEAYPDDEPGYSLADVKR